MTSPFSTPPEEHKHESRELRGKRRKLQKLGRGYALHFPGTIGSAVRLFGFVSRERDRCPFLTFHVAFKPEGRGIWLYMGRDEQVESYLDELKLHPDGGQVNASVLKPPASVSFRS